MDKLQNIHHLLGRAAFGPALKEMPGYLTSTTGDITNKLFAASRNYTPLHTVSPIDLTWQQYKMMSVEEKRAFRKKNRQMIAALNTAWIEKMISDDAVLREKMTFFWHDHFACRTNKAFFAQDLNNRLRKNALGNFGELLMDVSKSPAMLEYLNNQQNRKQHPNENFAREVMELFTLGIGHYTEDDVKNAARAFTGWSTNFQGEFVYKRKSHDFGTKTFLGKTGDFGGEDVIRIILEQKQTARHITRKIYSYFVNEQVDEEFAEELAGYFYDSDYNLEKLMYRLFTDDRFYAEKNHLCLVRSPVELLVSYGRLLPVTVENKKALISLQRRMDQVLFYPPNVGGWPTGNEWINSTSLPIRMQLPEGLNSANGNGKKKPSKNGFYMDWPKFIRTTKKLSSGELALLVLGKEPSDDEQKIINRVLAGNSKVTDWNAHQVIAWMSMPEYQLS